MRSFFTICSTGIPAGGFFAAAAGLLDSAAAAVVAQKGLEQKLFLFHRVPGDFSLSHLLLLLLLLQAPLMMCVWKRVSLFV